MGFNTFLQFEKLFSVSLRNGLTRPKSVRGLGVKMINMGEIFAYSRINNIRMGRVPLSQKEANSYLLEPNDLLFARQSLVRSGAGKCSIFLGDSESVTWESHIIRARLNKNIACPQFYYYFFNSILGRQAIDSIVEQVAAAGIRGSDLAKLPVPFPPLPEQEAIAHILGTLDDKIELNQQMNQTLEAMARAIFKSWFVDFDPVRAKMEGRQPVGMDAATAEVFPDSFEESALGLIPKGWRVGTISDLGKIVTGKTPSTKISKYFGGNIPFITPSDMDGRKIMRKTARYLTKEGANSVQTAQIPAESILVSCIGSDMGKVTCTARSSVTNQQINSIIVYKKYSKEYVYYNLSSRKIELLNLAGGGSAVPILNKGHFSIIDILLPNEKLLRNFEKLANLISIKIEKNDEQSETLTNLRDILLSKLISGEIRVKEAEKLLEAVA